jgi:hypothetical protein
MRRAGAAKLGFLLNRWSDSLKFRADSRPCASVPTSLAHSPNLNELFLISSESPLNIDKRWFLLLAVVVGAASAAAGAAVASKSRRHHHRKAHDLEHKTQLKSWENEGGNLAPIAAVPALP